MHQFRDKKQILKKKRYMKNAIFGILFILFAGFGIFSYTRGFLNLIGIPLWHFKNVVDQKIDANGYVLRTKSSVFKENQSLLTENSNLKASMIDYNMIKSENDHLKELFGRIQGSKNLVLVNILSKPNHSPYDTIIIDGGENLNISTGNVIYANAEIPIGEITKVYADTSLATLYSSPGKMTEASIDTSNATIVLVGRGGGNFEATIPIDLEFNIGSFVYLPSLHPEIAAIIEEVISSPNDPVKKVLLTSPINIQNQKWVFVKK